MIHRLACPDLRSARTNKPMRLLVSLSLMLLCLGARPAAAAEELGRLFMTPQQRQDLDRRRTTNRAEEEVPQIREGPLTLDGHVQRSSGKTATWINGIPQYDTHKSRDLAHITVAPNEGEPGVDLKIGQTFDRASGEIRGLLGGGEIRVQRPAQPATPRPPSSKKSAQPR